MQGSISVVDGVKPIKKLDLVLVYGRNTPMWEHLAFLSMDHFGIHHLIRQPSVYQQNKLPSSHLSVLAGILYQHLQNECQTSHVNIIKCSTFLISLEVFLIDRSISNQSCFLFFVCCSTFSWQENNCYVHIKRKLLEAIQPHEHLSRYLCSPWLYECALMQQDLVICKQI